MRAEGIRELVKRYGVRIAALAVMMFALGWLSSLAPYLSGLFAWLDSALLLPLIALLAIRLAGGILISRSYGPPPGRALYVTGITVKGLVGPMAFFYLFLGDTLTEAIRLGLIPAAYASPLFTSALIMALGGSIAGIGGGLSGPPRGSLRYLGAAVLLTGLSGVASVFYAPLGSLILYPAIAAAILALVLLVGVYAPLRPVADDVVRISGSIMFIFFLAGLLWFLAGVPELSPYSGYIRLAAPIIISATMALVGYRLYLTYSRASEAIAETVYEQHLRKSQLITTNDDEDLAGAVSAFIVNGRKEELLAYASYALSPCHDEFSGLKGSLSGLLEYVPPAQGGIWPWERERVVERAEREARKRAEIVRAILEEIRKCGGPEPPKGRT